MPIRGLGSRGDTESGKSVSAKNLRMIQHPAKTLDASTKIVGTENEKPVPLTKG